MNKISKSALLKVAEKTSANLEFHVKSGWVREEGQSRWFRRRTIYYRLYKRLIQKKPQILKCD